MHSACIGLVHAMEVWMVISAYIRYVAGPSAERDGLLRARSKQPAAAVGGSGVHRMCTDPVHVSVLHACA